MCRCVPERETEREREREGEGERERERGGESATETARKLESVYSL